MKRCALFLLICFLGIHIPHSLYSQNTGGTGGSTGKAGENTGGTSGESKEEEDDKKSATLFVRIKLKSGTFYTPLDRIVSVSTQTYIMDNAVEVTEAVIDTDGNAIARFFYLERMDKTLVQQAVEQGLESKGVPVSSVQSMMKDVQKTVEDVAGVSETSPAFLKVMKNYPTITHARTIEYRLANKQTVNNIYKMVERALRLRRSSDLRE